MAWRSGRENRYNLRKAHYRPLKLLSGTLRGLRKETDSVAHGEDPLKKRQQQLRGPGDIYERLK